MLFTSNARPDDCEAVSYFYTDHEATLRLAFDDWAIVWLNGTKLATLDHTGGFNAAMLPVFLRKGENQLVIKTNNQQNTDRLIWVLNCVVEAP